MGLLIFFSLTLLSIGLLAAYQDQSFSLKTSTILFICIPLLTILFTFFHLLI